jgi:hypothetical protein
MSTTNAPSRLLEELATLFASNPTGAEILAFRPSPTCVARATELLELNRQHQLDESTREELAQYEQGELLMRLVKARVRENQPETRSRQ